MSSGRSQRLARRAGAPRRSRRDGQPRGPRTCTRGRSSSSRRTPALHRRQRLRGEPRGGLPVIALDRHEATFGEEDGHEGAAASAGRGIDGAGEDRIRALGVPLEQVGHAVDVEHRRPVRAGRAEAVERELGVVAHPGEPVAAQERPQVGQRRRDAAAVGQRADRRRALGRKCPALRVGRPAHQREHQRAVHGDGRVAARSSPLVSNQRIQRRTVSERPLAHTGLASCSTSRATVSASPATWAWSRAASGRSLSSNHAAARRWSSTHQLRLAPPQLGQQLVTEEVVVAVPLPPPVERHHQEVAALEPLEHIARTDAPRGPRRTADRSCGRGATCGSGTSPPPATPGRGTAHPSQRPRRPAAAGPRWRRPTTSGHGRRPGRSVRCGRAPWRDTSGGPPGRCRGRRASPTPHGAIRSAHCASTVVLP